MISVVIPCYNVATFIDRAIQSVLIQDYKNWEIILVNNNSTDNTRDVLLDYQKKYPGSISVFEETKKGGCAARNKGIRESKGEWIQFLDADDELLPGKFTRQINLMKENGTDFIAGNFARVITVKGYKFRFTKGINSEDPWAGLIAAGLGVTSANLFSAKGIKEVSGWDESLTSSQEYDMMFRLLSQGAKVTFDLKLSALIYYESNSVSRSADLNKNISLSENYVNLRLRIQKYLVETGKLNIGRKKLIQKLIYAYLMNKQNIIPSYVQRKMQELNLDVSWRERLTIRFRIAGKQFVKQLSAGNKK